MSPEFEQQKRRFKDPKLASEAGKKGGKAKHPNKGFGSRKRKQELER